MAKQNKFLTWYDTLNEKEGTTHERESLVNVESEKETNITQLIEKYGMEALALKTKPEKELYLDMTMYDGYDLNRIIEQREEIKQYYEQMPSKVRKSYADNFENFYEKLKNGDLDGFVEQGILTEEHEKAIKDYISQQKNAYKQAIIEDYKLQEQAKAEAQAETTQEGE